MRILALDLARSTGWAVGDQKTIISGTRRFNEADFGDLAVNYKLWLEGLIDEHKPDLVAYESPVVKHPHAAKILVGLSWLVIIVCKEHNIPYLSVPNTSVKKFFCGKIYGKTTKPYPGIVEARRRGFDPQTTDEADAIAILLYIRDKGTDESGSRTASHRKSSKRK